MWEEQCHKPPITWNSLYQLFINCWVMSISCGTTTEQYCIHRAISFVRRTLDWWQWHFQESGGPSKSHDPIGKLINHEMEWRQDQRNPNILQLDAVVSHHCLFMFVISRVFLVMFPCRTWNLTKSLASSMGKPLLEPNTFFILEHFFHILGMIIPLD